MDIKGNAARIVQVTQLRCQRCGHKWFPRGGKRPKKCPVPKCATPRWDRAPKWRRVVVDPEPRYVGPDEQ